MIRFRCCPIWRRRRRHIGVASTFSVSQHHPFYAARLWATLDHLTEGRAGWNVVTSINHNQDGELRGVDRPPADVALRPRARVHGGVPQAVGQLGADAVVMDREARRLRRPGQGASHRARGAVLQVAGAAQRRPLAAERPGDPSGGDVGKGPSTSPPATRTRSSPSSRTWRVPRATTGHQGEIAARGRKPDACKILFGIQPILGQPRQRRGRSRRCTTRSCRSRAAWPSCPGASTSTCRRSA